jgi:hypothetical protein
MLGVYMFLMQAAVNLFISITTLHSGDLLLRHIHLRTLFASLLTPFGKCKVKLRPDYRKRAFRASEGR